MLGGNQPVVSMPGNGAEGHNPGLRKLRAGTGGQASERCLIIIVIVYDCGRHGGSGEQLALRAIWEAIARHKQVVIAGDLNAHSQMWNVRVTSRRNSPFWENLITDH